MTRKIRSKTQCHIGPGTALTGNLRFLGTLRVDGAVLGDVAVADEGAGMLILGPQGFIEGNIQVDEAIVDGRVKGCIAAQGTVILRSQARVEGDVHYRQIEISNGARVTGRLHNAAHDAKESAPASSHPSAGDTPIPDR